MSNIKVYGIPNCDSVKKALNWLTQNEIPFEFHDYKKVGVSADTLKMWCRLKGWDIIFNKKSSTWKKLMATQESLELNESEAIKIMQVHNSIIKRPIVDINGDIIVGFDETAYTQKISSPIQKNHKK
jgi:Spx/MgsR family transcriptional regulator